MDARAQVGAEREQVGGGWAQAAATTREQVEVEREQEVALTERAWVAVVRVMEAVMKADVRT